MDRKVGEGSSQDVQDEPRCGFVQAEVRIGECLHHVKQSVSHLHLHAHIFVALEAEGNKVEHHFVFENNGGLENFSITQVHCVVKNFEHDCPSLVCFRKLDKFLVSDSEDLLRDL